MLDSRKNTGSGDQAILAGLYAQDGHLSPDTRLDELESLVAAAGGRAVGRVIQRRGLSRGEDTAQRPVDPATYLGRGKIDEIQFEIVHRGANLQVSTTSFARPDSRSRSARLSGHRPKELILDIFAARARTREAMLQVDLHSFSTPHPACAACGPTERQAGGGGGRSGGIGTRT